MAHKYRLVQGAEAVPDRLREYSLYRALARLSIEASDFTLNPSVSPADLRRAIAAPSIRRNSSVAPKALVLNPTVADLSVAALRRRKDYLDVGAMLLDGTSREIRAVINERFGDAERDIRPEQLRRYKRFNISVGMQEDGGVWWEYNELPGGGYYPPRVDDQPYGASPSSNLQIYLVNLIRADLQARIEKMTGGGG